MSNIELTAGLEPAARLILRRSALDVRRFDIRSAPYQLSRFAVPLPAAS
jgi:hypothetical protein